MYRYRLSSWRDESLEFFGWNQMASDVTANVTATTRSWTNMTTTKTSSANMITATRSWANTTSATRPWVNMTTATRPWVNMTTATRSWVNATVATWSSTNVTTTMRSLSNATMTSSSSMSDATTAMLRPSINVSPSYSAWTMTTMATGLPLNNTEDALPMSSDPEDVWLYIPGQVFNRPLHAILLLIIILMAVTLNALIISNIHKHELKSRTVTFVLIEYMCMVDFGGALVMLPFPLYASLHGGWTLGSKACSVNAAINIGIWIQHFVLYMLLKLDRASASCLPIGRYPLIPPKVLRVLFPLTLIFSFSVSTATTLTSGARFHTVVLLCTPRIPPIVYRVMLISYSVSMSVSTLTNLVILFYLKKQQRKVYNAADQMHVKDYRLGIQSAFIVLYITVTNLVISAPTMFVLGRPDIQALLPPIALLAIDGLFYSEFLLHPFILLTLSGRLRKEIKTSLYSFIKQCAAAI